MTYYPSSLVSTNWKTPGAEFIELLRNKKIGNQILLYMFVGPDGKVNTYNINKRSYLSKTDDEVVNERHVKTAYIASKELEAGIRLLHKTYAMGLLQTSEKFFKDDEYEGFNANGQVYVAKMNFHEVQEKIRLAIKENRDLKSFISELEITWSLVFDTKVNTIASQKTLLKFTKTGNFLVDSYQKITIPIQNKRIRKNQISLDSLKLQIPQLIYNAQISEATKAISDFQPRAPINSIYPIRIKVGTKEMVKVGQRWEVLETTEQNGEIKEKHVGYIRASRVTKNSGMATGQTKPSIFYQEQGGKITPGMLATWNNDIGGSHGLSIYYKLKPQSYTGNVLLQYELNWLVPARLPLNVGIVFQWGDFDKRLQLESNSLSTIGFHVKQGFPISRNVQFDLGSPFLLGRANLDDYVAYGVQPNANLQMRFKYGISANVCYGYRLTNYNSTSFEPQSIEITPVFGFGLRQIF